MWVLCTRRPPQLHKHMHYSLLVWPVWITFSRVISCVLMECSSLSVTSIRKREGRSLQLNYQPYLVTSRFSSFWARGCVLMFSGAGPVCGLSPSGADLSLCWSVDLCCLSLTSAIQRLYWTGEIYFSKFFFFIVLQYKCVLWLQTTNRRLVEVQWKSVLSFIRGPAVQSPAPLVHVDVSLNTHQTLIPLSKWLNAWSSKDVL